MVLVRDVEAEGIWGQRLPDGGFLVSYRLSLPFRRLLADGYSDWPCLYLAVFIGCAIENG